MGTPFESSVLRRLVDAGLPARLHYGTGGSWIDIAVADGQDRGRMVLAVMTDGTTYLGDRSVRDRERLRPEHLERLGWTIFRLDSRSWLADPTDVVEEVRRCFDRAEASDGN